MPGLRLKGDNKQHTVGELHNSLSKGLRYACFAYANLNVSTLRQRCRQIR